VANSDRFRDFLRTLINQRRKEMALEKERQRGDFLSMMLNDDLFRDKEDYLVDECLTFMVAATMTSTMLVNSAIYYLT
jgi:cytochrome P450